MTRVPPGSSMMPRVLLEQDGEQGAVVVDKPAGLLVHNSAWAGPREETVTDLLRTRYVDAVPVHRLDRQTSGCLIFARHKSGAQRLQEQLTTSPKRYLALVRGHVAAALDVDHPLDDDDVPGSPRLEARSRLEPLASSEVDRCSLLLVTLLTGRRHQARRHCKHVSHPILGDATHGKGPLNRAYRDQHGLGRMALHAVSVVVDGVVVVAPLPPDLLVPFRKLFPGLDLEAPALLAKAPLAKALLAKA